MARIHGASTRLVGTLGTTMLVTGLGFITSVLVARSLGPSGRGVLLALTFWPAVITAVLSFSINESTTYHVARATLGSRGGDPFASSGLLLQLSIAAVMTPVAVAAIWAYHLESGHEELTVLLWYMALFMPLSLLDLHFKAVLQGSGNFRALNAIRLVQPAGYAIAVGVLFLSKSVAVYTVMIAMLATSAASAVAGAGCSGIPRLTWRWPELRETLDTGFRFHLANVLYYASTEADKLIVLELMNTKNVGYYAVGIGLSTLGTGIAVQSLTLLLGRDMPLASRDAQVNLLAQSLVVGCVLLTSINVLAAVSVPYWLPLLYGTQFKPAVPIVMILLVMGTFKGMRQIIDRALRASRRVRAGITSELIAVSGLVVFGCAGAYTHGIVGLVCGLAVSQLVALIVIWHLAARAFVVTPRELGIVCRVSFGRLRHSVRSETPHIFTR